MDRLKRLLAIAPNRVLGAALLVAGTTIGAGMLAMPSTAGSLGFPLSVLVMVLIWLIMYSTAMFIVRLSAHYGGHYSLVTIATKGLGKGAALITAIATVCLFYALIAAYLSGLASVARFFLPLFTHNQYVIASIFALGLLISSHALADYTNRALFCLKVASFCIILYVLLPKLELPTLLHYQDLPLRSWISVIPIFFTSFGFHGSIAAITSYLQDGSSNSIPHRDHTSYLRIARKVMLFGSLVPLLFYILWLMLTLGHPDLTNSTGLSSSDDFMRALTNSAGANFIYCFGLCAIGTSLIGVAVGLSSFFYEFSPRNKTVYSALKNYGAVISIPAICCLRYPNLFISALSLAAVFLSILSIFVPCLAVLKLYYTRQKKNIPTLSDAALAGRDATLADFNKIDVYWSIAALLFGISLIVMEIGKMC